MKKNLRDSNLNLGRRRAFTLIELLMVIGIIGLLAALLVGSSGVAGRLMKEKRVRAELHELETAISVYKDAFGSYPPDNPTNVAQPPLLYELMGVRTMVGGPVGLAFTNGNEILLSNDARLYLGVQGIQNTVVSPNDADIKSFLPKLNPRQFTNSPSPSAVAVKLLVVPVEGPLGRVNPWNYNSSSPIHNPRTFDLWAEIVVGGKTNIIGNWKN